MVSHDICQSTDANSLEVHEDQVERSRILFYSTHSQTTVLDDSDNVIVLDQSSFQQRPIDLLVLLNAKLDSVSCESTERIASLTHLDNQNMKRGLALGQQKWHVRTRVLAIAMARNGRQRRWVGQRRSNR